jgi:hypothetical protein
MGYRRLDCYYNTIGVRLGQHRPASTVLIRTRTQLYNNCSTTLPATMVQKCGSNLRLLQCFDVVDYTVTYATLIQKTYRQISRTSTSHCPGRQGHRLLFYATRPTICGDILPPSLPPLRVSQQTDSNNMAVGKDIECGAELTAPEERSPYKKLRDAHIAELAAKFKVVEAASQDL